MRYRILTIVGVPLGVVLLVIMLTVSAYSAAKVQPVTKLALYDAKGTLVGGVVPTAEGFGVQIKVGQTFVFLGVDRDVFYGSRSTSIINLFYVSSDCTGQPLLQAAAGFTFPPTPNLLTPTVALTPPNGSQQLYEATGPATSVAVNSQFDGATCSTEGLPVDSFLPAGLIADLAKEFKPPFTLRASN